MSRLATSFVLGYHGCDRQTADRVISGETGLLHSREDYDWLGHGSYFWESDPRRALEWAEWQTQRGKVGTPAVVGAVIDLGNCLDLVSRRDLELVRRAHESFVKSQALAGLEMPRNMGLRGIKRGDLPLRYLDCAVIRHLHNIMKAEGLEPFDTVRALFREGGRLYAGSGFMDRTHVQIAVINDSCVKGLFLPLP